jgi:tetratricopeptide (TPR) repeat protein
MAFGFGFNKQKVLSAAEKFVQQGKLQNAISEYEKVLKADSKDLTVMNTVGDLYARLGENEKAAECFKNVGDAYAGQGFTVKAIAMYKKLGKLKSSTESVLRLAELYTQQGLFNDARAQYLQVAEEFLKSGKPDQAIRIFQKTLEMDPENIPMRMRLAEAYVRMGKKDDAWQLLSTAAETLRSKGQLAAANEILQKMLKLDPANSYALVLRGRACVEAGDYPAAIDSLSKVSDLDNNADGLRALFQAYLHSKRFEDASTLVTKLANVHSDTAAVFDYGNALVEAQQFTKAVQLYSDFSDPLLRADSGRLFECIRALLGFVKDDPQQLELILAIFQKGGETSHLTDIYELLAHGYVQSGELPKAREYYKKLMQLEPANQMHATNYQQVSDKLGAGSDTPHVITAEEGAALVDELEASAPLIEQVYDDEVALAVKAALTDAELFISYNMPAKALDPLISVLPKAPRDLRVNQKLASLHTRAGRFAEAAVCCRTLESIYHDAGHAAEASRYGEIAARYEQRSAPAHAPVPAVVARPAAVAPVMQEFEISVPSIEENHAAAAEPPAALEPAPPVQSAPTGLFFQTPEPASHPPVAQSRPAAHHEVQEFSVAGPSEAAGDAGVDSWEQDFAVEAPQPEAVESSSVADHTVALNEPEATSVPLATEAASDPEAPAAVDIPNLDESIEEVRFYLGQGMIAQAEQVLEKLEALAPGAPELAVLRLGINSAKEMPIIIGGPEIAVDESPTPEPVQADANVEVETDQETPQIEAAVAAPAGQVAPQPWPAPREIPAIPTVKPEPVVSASAPKEQPAAQPDTAPVTASTANNFGLGTLDAFVADLEASLGSDFLPGESAPEADPPAPPPSAAKATSAPATPSTLIQPPVASVGLPSHQEAPVAPVARAAAAAASSPVASSLPSPAPPAPSMAPPVAIDANVSVDLSSMFGELKQELEQDAASAEEDPETHYNLGVAFREMGLLDEAIGELQKVCQYVECGRSFPHVIQAYTWLAQCFLDKGVPEVAARWYEKALKLPALDQETRTALHYELASALEMAGRRPEALNHFLEVYSANIDYRDVSERIKALRT